MTAKKAKQIIDLNISNRDPKMPQDVLQALKLSVNSLDRHIHRHTLTYTDLLLPLPGETPND